VELVLDGDVRNNVQKPCYVNPNVGMNIYKLNKISFQISITKVIQMKTFLESAHCIFTLRKFWLTGKSHLTFG
jgi:hypothetical protein